MNRGFSIQNVALMFLCGLLLRGSAAVAQTPRFAVTDIPTFGGPYGYAYAINNLGSLAGLSYRSTAPGDYLAFLYSSNTLYELSPNIKCNPFGINDRNYVVGESYGVSGSDDFAFLYRDGDFQTLPTLGGCCGYASAINNRDQIVGYSTTALDQTSHAFLYQNGVLEDIHIEGDYSYAAAINDLGDVVGHFRKAGIYHPCLWPAQGGQIDLNSSAVGTKNTANSINNNGQAAGRIPTFLGAHAALYETAGGRIEITDLDPVNNRSSVAYGINDRGRVFGTFTDASRTHPFLWTSNSTGGRMIELNTLIPTTGLSY